MNDVTPAPRATEPVAAAAVRIVHRLRADLALRFWRRAGVVAPHDGRGAALADAGTVQRSLRAVLVPARAQHCQLLGDFRFPGARAAWRFGRAGRAARPTDGADHRYRHVVCALRRSTGAATRADRRYRSGGRADHVARGKDGAAAVP